MGKIDRRTLFGWLAAAAPFALPITQEKAAADEAIKLQTTQYTHGARVRLPYNYTVTQEDFDFAMKFKVGDKITGLPGGPHTIKKVLRG